MGGRWRYRARYGDLSGADDAAERDGYGRME